MTQFNPDPFLGELLVVDDTLINLQVLTGLLQAHGYRVRGAVNGELALGAVAQQAPDLILLDIKMPKMDGYEVCQALKENPATHDIPVIFISALNDPLDKVKAFESGGVDYVSKPFDELEVLARVKTHLQLYAFQQHLEAEVARRTRNWREAHAAMEKALAAKQEFLSLMSHEFRTPLNGILGMSRMLKRELEGRHREYAELIERSGWRLFKLVDNLLKVVQVGKIDSSPDSPSPPLDVKLLCRLMLESVTRLAEPKRITTDLQAENLPLLNTPLSSSRLSQIIGNLLDNAIKFTPEGGQIGIQAYYSSEDKQLIIMVWDTGPGISIADQDRIFEPFVQLDSLRSRRHEGPGLGLTLARNLAELHGGRIMLSDRQGGGSLFLVRLPAYLAE